MDVTLYDGPHAELTHRIIGCAIEVHRHLGPGLLETVYETAMVVEFDTQAIPFQRQMGLPLYYKGQLISEHRPDLIVDDAVVVEIKSVKHVEPIHKAQVLTYLRVTGHRGAVTEFQQHRHEEWNPPPCPLAKGKSARKGHDGLCVSVSLWFVDLES